MEKHLNELQCKNKAQREAAPKMNETPFVFLMGF